MTDAPIADYESCIQDIIGRIATNWDTYCKAEFWRLANAFTTLIDAFVITKNAHVSLGDSAYDSFTAQMAKKWWYDDYGWLCIATLRAAQYSQFVGHDAAAWNQLALESWKAMAPATQVWHNADKTKFARAKPRFEGGCWNHDFDRSAKPPCDPLATSTLCGIQNTVTNMQYLVCAARLSRADDVKRQYGWFAHWSTDRALSPDEKLLVGYGDAGTLVRERVSTFDKAPDGKYPPAPGYEADRRWSGDQGILLGALVEMARLDPGRQADYYDLARSILDGVRQKLTDGQILQPWTPPYTMEGDPDDYSTGVGVFMRYLLYVYNAGDQVLKPYIASDDYKAFIRANADAVCGSIGTCAPLPDGRTMQPMECLVNQLAIVNAATMILRK